MEQGSNSLFEVNIDAQASYTLRNAASWAKIIAVCGFFTGVIFFVAGIFVPELYRTAMTRNGSTMVAVIYFALGGAYFVSSSFALRFANKTIAGLRANDQTIFNKGLSAMRNYFVFWGMLMLVGTLLLVLGVIGIAVNAHNY